MIIKARDAFDEQINSIFKKRKSDDIDLILQAVSFVLFGTQNNTDLLELYHLLGLESFIKVVSLFSEKTVSFPRKKDLRKTILLAILYYYKEILGMSWETIKKDFPFEISSISFGIQLKNLKVFVKQKLSEIFRKYSKNKKIIGQLDLFFTQHKNEIREMISKLDDPLIDEEVQNVKIIEPRSSLILFICQFFKKIYTYLEEK
jgi:hypothetical protein